MPTNPGLTSEYSDMDTGRGYVPTYEPSGPTVGRPTGLPRGEYADPRVGQDPYLPPPLPTDRKRKSLPGEGLSDKPTTGLPPVVVVDDWNPDWYKKDTPPRVDDPYYREWEDDIKKKTSPVPPKEEKAAPRNVLPTPQQKDPPPTFVDKNKKYWVWNECNKRWWTPDVVRITPDNTVVNGVGGSGGTFGGSNISGGPQSFGNASVNGRLDAGPVAWSTWDAFNQTWIRRTADQWCTPEDKFGIPPQDDCAKYGINCPDPLPSGKIFTRIDDIDKLPGRFEVNTYGIWSEGSGSLYNFYTCSISEISTSFARTIINRPCGNCGAEAQYDIAYGHDGGSGSQDLGGYDWLTPSNAVYGQYRLLCLGGEKQWFTIGNRRLHHIYVINIRRSRMQDKIDEGNIEINLAQLSGSIFLSSGNPRNAHTGSNVKVAGNGQIIRLIDDSTLDYEQLSPAAMSSSYAEIGEDRAKLETGAKEVFYMISGSLETGAYSKTEPVVYGLLYPRLGVVILDGDMMDSNVGFLSVTGSDIAGDNNYKLFTAMSGAALYTDDSGDRLGFAARRKKTEYSEYYFIRVKNNDYNFTNNKTYQTGSYGEIITDFMGKPMVYITEVGLYNDRKECLAVGKLSRPIQKDYVNEALFTVRLGL